MAEAKAARRSKRCGARWGMPTTMCLLLLAAHVWCSLLAVPHLDTWWPVVWLGVAGFAAAGFGVYAARLEHTIS